MVSELSEYINWRLWTQLGSCLFSFYQRPDLMWTHRGNLKRAEGKTLNVVHYDFNMCLIHTVVTCSQRFFLNVFFYTICTFLVVNVDQEILLVSSRISRPNSEHTSGLCENNSLSCDHQASIIIIFNLQDNQDNSKTAF